MLSTQQRTEMVGGNALPDVLPSTGRTKVRPICFRFCLSLLSEMRYITYNDPFFTRKTSISEQKNSLMTPFLFSFYFHTHPITLLLEILGGRMHRPSPTFNFEGDRTHGRPPGGARGALSPPPPGI